MEGSDSCYVNAGPWAPTFETVEQLKHLKPVTKTSTPEELALIDSIYKPSFTRGGNKHTYRKGNV